MERGGERCEEGEGCSKEVNPAGRTDLDSIRLRIQFSPATTAGLLFWFDGVFFDILIYCKKYDHDRR